MGTGILWMAMAIECPTMSWSHGWDDVEHSNWAVFLAAANTVCVTHNWWYKHLIMHTGLGDPLPHLYTRLNTVTDTVWSTKTQCFL